MKNYWKRFSFYDKSLAVFLIINLGLDIINKKAFDSAIPNEIVGYLFWLSLGLFLGFQLCKHEFRQVMIKQDEELSGRENKNLTSTSGLSEN